MRPLPVKPYTSRVSGDYQSYDEALAACVAPVYETGAVTGIDLSARAKKYKRRVALGYSLPHSPKMSARLIPYQAALSYVDRSAMAVLDVGGDDGRCYHELKGVYGDGFCPRWDVLEAPEVIDANKAIGVSDVGFIDNIATLRGRSYSHIIFGAMLQVMPDPEAFFREVSCAAMSDYIFVAVFPEHDDDKDRLGIKRLKNSAGSDVSHPYWVFSSKKWRALFQEFGQIIAIYDMPRFRLKMDGLYSSQRGYLIRMCA